MIEHLLIGFSLGFAGSLHCVGMCGPIIMMFKLKKTFPDGFPSQVLYHSGRIFVYGLIGLVIGLFGYGLIQTGIQQILSIVLGFLLIIYAVSTYMLHIQILERFVPSGMMGNISSYISGYMANPGKNKPLILGALNGLLPCGLVYVAVANALVVSNPVYSALSMMSFGIGTLPALFFVPALSGFFSKFRKWTFSAVIPIFLIGISLILIYRGISIYPPIYDKANQIISICMP